MPNKECDDEAYTASEYKSYGMASLNPRYILSSVNIY